MPSLSATDGFSHLFALGLITGEEHESAKAFSKPILVKPGSTPADYLVWMVEQRIVSHGGLLQITDAEAGASDSGASKERDNVLERALTELESRAETLNAKLFDELVSAGLISTIDRDLTLNQGLPYVLGTPGSALAYVVDCGVMTRERFAQLIDKVQAKRGTEAGETQARVVAEADVILQALDMVRESEQTASKRPGWHVALEMLLWIFVGFQVLNFISSFSESDAPSEQIAAQAAEPASVPACDDRKTIFSVRQMARPSLSDLERGVVEAPISVSEVRQVGYASKRGERGCIAMLTVGDTTALFGFVIGTLPGRGGHTGVMGAQREMVEARYSKIGKDGNFIHNADPIGRDKFKQALRAGADAAGGARAATFEPEDVVAALNGLNLDRRHDIVDVEPLDACREMQPGTHYACRVLVEYDDRMFGTLGIPPRIFEAEFTFVRDPGSRDWRMSDDFASAYREVTSRTRLELFTRKTKQQP